MNIFSFLTSERQTIVERLLNNGDINVHEAAVLLKSRDTVHIGKIDVSSGAKIIAGNNADAPLTFGQDN